MKRSIILLAVLLVGVAYNMQAQIRDGKPHAYRSTLDTCQKENLSLFVFDGERVYTGHYYFKAEKKLYIDDGITLPRFLIWNFSHKDDNGNSIYRLENDSTKYLCIPQYPKIIIVETEDTLRHLKSSALEGGKLEWDSPYFDKDLSPHVFYTECPSCQGSGWCNTCYGKGWHLFFGSKTPCPYCNGNGICRYCMGQGKTDLIIKSVKRTGGGVALPPKK